MRGPFKPSVGFGLSGLVADPDSPLVSLGESVLFVGMTVLWAFGRTSHPRPWSSPAPVSPADHECSIFKIVDTASSQPGGLLLPKSIEQESNTDSQPAGDISGLPQSQIQELWLIADAAMCSLTVEEFGTI